MDTNLFFVTAPFCLFVLLLTLELIRRRRLKEKYALIWLAASLSLMLLSIFNKVILYVAPLVRLHHLTLVVLLAFFFLVLLCMSFSLSLSRLAESNKKLNQEMALLAQKVETLQADSAEKDSRRLGA